MTASGIDYSIIIPTRNRPDHLSACLAAIAQVRYSNQRFEVIVVDDGGAVALDHVLSGFQGSLQVFLLRQPHSGPGAARNLGAFHARGEYLAFTDDDCAPTPGWLSQLQAVLAKSPDVAIGGLTVNALETNLYSMASQMLIAYLCEYFNHNRYDAIFLTSSNLTFPAERFRQLGGFSAEFVAAGGEDREFCDRWRHAGFRLSYVTDVVVKHFHALTLYQFWRQHLNYGRGGYRFHQLRYRRGGGSVRIEPLRFYNGMLSLPFGRVSFPRALAIDVLMAISQIANATGFMWEKFRLSGQGAKTLS
jgi:glycosyltransferase involved in cell wall biosynthesis